MPLANDLLQALLAILAVAVPPLVAWALVSLTGTRRGRTRSSRKE